MKRKKIIDIKLIRKKNYDYNINISKTDNTSQIEMSQQKGNENSTWLLNVWCCHLLRHKMLTYLFIYL